MIMAPALFISGLVYDISGFSTLSIWAYVALCMEIIKSEIEEK